ncbi:tryptophan-specific transport protein-1 [Pasteurella canis]|nr:tryptophan-specific transport protein-1 [Pasteurella canis]
MIESASVKQAINAFSIAAILSSFIGVGLGVFDFLADFFKFDNSKQGRFKSWAVTFLPPLILSVSFPLGFLKRLVMQVQLQQFGLVSSQHYRQQL